MTLVGTNVLDDVVEDAVIGNMNNCHTIYLEDFHTPIGFSTLHDYFKKNSNTLKLLYENKLLTDKKLDPILEQKVIAEAKLYIRLECTRGNSSATGYYIFREPFLAYALKKNSLSEKEMNAINFGTHTKNSYIERFYKDNLIEIVREDLFNPVPEPKMIFDEHPVCNGC